MNKVISSELPQSQESASVSNDAAAHVRMEPSCSLPWMRDGDVIQPKRGGIYIARMCSNIRNPVIAQDADYIVHSANAYPRLVGLLKRIHETEEGVGETDRPLMIELRTLLKELGE